MLITLLYYKSNKNKGNGINEITLFNNINHSILSLYIYFIFAKNLYTPHQWFVKKVLRHQKYNVEMYWNVFILNIYLP